MRHLILSACILILSGCTSRQSSSGILKLNEGIRIEAYEYPEELIITNPLNIAVVGKKLLLFQHSGEYAVLTMDTEKGIIDGHWGIRGNGPGEFTIPVYWGQDNTKRELYLYDMNSRFLRAYNWQTGSDTLSFSQIQEKRINTDAYIRNGAILKNQTAAVSVIFNQTSPVMLLDNDLKMKDLVEGLPGQNNSSTDQRSYSGVIGSYGNAFVFGMEKMGYLSYYELSDSTARKKWEVCLENPVYEGGVLAVDRLKQGFVDVKMTGHYIYCSYCGAPYNQDFVAHNILIFDHDGNLVRNLELDREVGHIAVSSDERYIYAVNYKPEIGIVRYTVENLPKR